jgi:hypothetical protein
MLNREVGFAQRDALTRSPRSQNDDPFLSGGPFMKFYIQGLDTSGSVTLHRESVPAAIKKATELISDGYLNVEIITPDGAACHAGEFDQLRERVGRKGTRARPTTQIGLAATWPVRFCI